MKNILVISENLVDIFQATLHGNIGNAPGDIDFFVKKCSLSQAIIFLRGEGFVLTNENCKMNHYVFRRFEDSGKLFIIDLMSDLNVMLEDTPYFKLSLKGNESIGTNVDKYSLLKKLSKKKISIFEFVDELPSFFENDDHFDKSSVGLGFYNFFKGGVLLRLFLHLFFFNLKVNRYYSKIYSGKRVAFVGPDGSGKSFIINKLVDIGRTENIYMGDWFFLLQTVYNKIKINIPTPFNRFVYLFYPPEQYIRTVRTYLWKLRGRIVLIDRFPGLNKNVSKSGVLGLLNSITFFMYPKPDIIFHLWAPAEIVYKRKQELTVKEIYETNLSLQNKLSVKGRLIDTTDIDKALNRILKIIYQG